MSYEEQEQSPHDRNYESLDVAASCLERTIEALASGDAAKAVREQEQALRAAEQALARARGRGYLYASDAEYLVGDAKAAFPEAASRVDAIINGARQYLSAEATSVLARARALGDQDLSYADGDVGWLSAEADRLEAEVSALSRRAAEASADFTSLVDEVVTTVNRTQFTLDLLESASFKLQPQEDVLFALQATYRDAPGRGTVKGVLFFTNQRVRFELRDVVVTERKLLFFASKTETKIELLLDEVLGKLASSDDIEEGVVFKDQLLHFTWASGVKCPQKTLHELLDGENARDWDGIIEMIRTGAFEQTRIQSASPVAVYSFPTDCQGCGGPLGGSVKGQTIVKCAYCKRDHAGVSA